MKISMTGPNGPRGIGDRFGRGSGACRGRIGGIGLRRGIGRCPVLGVIGVMTVSNPEGSTNETGFDFVYS